MKTYNSISINQLMAKMSAAQPRFNGREYTRPTWSVPAPRRYSETNIFLAAIRMDYLPSELGHIMCALQSYRYDLSLILTSQQQFNSREAHEMSTWWLTFDAAVLEYTEDTLPSENVEYWNSIRDMAAHAHMVLRRMRNLVA